MSKNTAMTDMINYLTRLETLVGNNYSDEIKGYITGAKTEATELLTKEREDIETAYKQGFINTIASTHKTGKAKLTTAEQYYETIFNQ